MKRSAGIIAVIGLAAIPTLAGPLGLETRPAAEPDTNHGRMVAIGGPLGELRVACAQCHGLDGVGDSSGAFPRLTDQSAWYVYSSLLDFAAGLRPSEVMEPIARLLTDRQMRDVAAYYAAIEGAPYAPKPSADAQLLQTGGAISAIGIPERGVPACESCHGESGVGRPPIYPFLAGQYAPYTEHQLMLWKQGKRGGDPLNVMEMIARNMTDEQIRAVALYFASVRPAEVTPDDRLFLEPRFGVPSVARETGADMGAVVEPQPGRGGVVLPGAGSGEQPQRGRDGQE